ncbi:MAG: hypothetical protein ACPHUL_00820 [Marinomonas gallaica]
MTNVQAIDAIATWLTDNGLLGGYTMQRFKVSAKNLQDDLPVALITDSGQGINNSHLEEQDYYIVLFGGSTRLRTLSDDINAVKALARSTVYPAGVVKCRALTLPTTPAEMENSVYQVSMQIRLTIEV